MLEVGGGGGGQRTALNVGFIFFLNKDISRISDICLTKIKDLNPMFSTSKERGEKSRGETQGGGAFHTLAKDISLNRGAIHFQLGLRPCFISFFLS